MAKVKIFGNWIEVRNSNRDHTVLDDLDNLYDLLLKKSMAQVAKELGVPANSIRHRVYKYFTSEMRDNLYRERRFHKNNKRQ